ncbi:FliH/SctL family protein [Pseudomonas sp. A1437]|uniref:FliH/SctL family protein n=1 Tax=Pseudomonas TaxID=286 RepID=UPI0021C24BC6|nr:FliH/SctL family protein [Pseudomonas iridis]MCT8945780.1 HrpE/YscL family type III secretion apparatus protein [Pseudomonas iridis]
MSSLPKQPETIILSASQASAWMDGYDFLDRAREQAAQMLANSAQQIADANAKGFAEGREAGAIEAAQLLLDTHRQVEHYIDGLQAQLGELALTIAEQCVGNLEDTELLWRLTQKALIDWRDGQRLTLRVAPSQLEPVERMLKLNPIRSDLCLAVSGDPQLQSRQCVLSSATVSVDLGLDTQLLNLRRALTANDLQECP